MNTYKFDIGDIVLCNSGPTGEIISRKGVGPTFHYHIKFAGGQKHWWSENRLTLMTKAGTQKFQVGDEVITDNGDLGRIGYVINKYSSVQDYVVEFQDWQDVWPGDRLTLVKFQSIAGGEIELPTIFYQAFQKVAQLLKKDIRFEIDSYPDDDHFHVRASKIL